MFEPTEEVIKRTLDLAHETIQQCVVQLDIEARIIRKERAVGIIPKRPGQKLRREVLDETAYALASTLNKNKVKIPFCAFNGGNDCFVDIGDKSIAIIALQKLTGAKGDQCLHIGDQFLTHGNDFPCRFVTAHHPLF